MLLAARGFGGGIARQVPPAAPNTGGSATIRTVNAGVSLAGLSIAAGGTGGGGTIPPGDGAGGTAQFSSKAVPADPQRRSSCGTDHVATSIAG
jgi:hypothetical protein